MHTNALMNNSTSSAISSNSSSNSPRHIHAEASPAVSEELRCRYSNKKCFNARTKNRVGGLHTFCDEHREAANRNQRRIDQRKRMEKRQQESIQAYYDTLKAAAENANNSQAPPHPHPFLSPGSMLPAVGVSPIFVEPFARPAALLDEDVNALVSLFGPNSEEEDNDY
jgi:hypothetical protein